MSAPAVLETIKRFLRLSAFGPAPATAALISNLAHEWIERTGKLAVRMFTGAPRALVFPDGLLAVHGGFPLADLHGTLAETGDWNDPACLSDFVGPGHIRRRAKNSPTAIRAPQTCNPATLLGIAE